MLTPVESRISEGVLEFRVARIVRGQHQRSRVSKDHRRAQLRVRVDLTVNAVSNAQVLGSHSDCDVFTLVNSATASGSGDKDRAVGAFTDLDTVDIGADVEVGVFAAHDAHVATRCHVRHVPHCHALVQERDVLWLVGVLLLLSK